jgi:hydroxyacylglutathione hydrolase
MSETTPTGGHAPTETQHGFSAIMLKMMKVAPLRGGDAPGGTTRLLSGYSSAYLFPIDDSSRAFGLIDTGSDAKAIEILAALEYRGVGPDAIKAIFITHGHSDHVAGIRQFPGATVYVGAGDRAVVEGTAKSDGFLPGLTGPLSKLAIADPARLQAVQDGQTITVGDRQIQAFSVPGHTRGSTAYLLDSTLFVGDTVTFDGAGHPQKPPAIVSYNIPEDVESLAKLVKRFDEQGISPDIQAVVPSHSGEGTLDAIRELVPSPQQA